MQKSSDPKESSKKKLVLRKESIRALDGVNLALVAGGADTAATCNPPPNRPT